MTTWSVSGGKLAIEDGLKKSCVRHVNQMARPTKLCLYKHGFNSGHLRYDSVLHAVECNFLVWK